MDIAQSEKQVRSAFANQVNYCRANDAPITARIVEAIAAALNRDTQFGREILDWGGEPLPDALPLRAAGGFHALHLSGAEPELAPLYAGDGVAMTQAESIIGAAIKNHENALMPWLKGPPQTNEAGRSSNYIAALLWLRSKGLPFRCELNEIGSSAGLNLLIDRYHYDLAGVTYGNIGAAIKFSPEWRGKAPANEPFEIESMQGCDIMPVDLADPAQSLRLTAYIWPEHHIRFDRMKSAIDLVKQNPPNLVQCDADIWVEQQLRLPQPKNIARVLMHSIVWQYLGEERQQRITDMMEKAGKFATPERPLAWISVEANRDKFKHELNVRYWNGSNDDGKTHMLGLSHAHGAWIKWLA